MKIRYLRIRIMSIQGIDLLKSYEIFVSDSTVVARKIYFLHIFCPLVGKKS
jgi:hypothetical protein